MTQNQHFHCFVTNFFPITPSFRSSLSETQTKHPKPVPLGFEPRQWLVWTPTCRWFRPARLPAALLLLPPQRSPNDLRSRSGTLLLSGPGILWLITVRFAGTISWISVLSAKRTKLAPLARSAQLHGTVVELSLPVAILYCLITLLLHADVDILPEISCECCQSSDLPTKKDFEGFATMHFTSTASADGLRHVKFVHWITASGSFRNTVTRSVVQLCCWILCCLSAAVMLRGRSESSVSFHKSITFC